MATPSETKMMLRWPSLGSSAAALRRDSPIGVKPRGCKPSMWVIIFSELPASGGVTTVMSWQPAASSSGASPVLPP